MADEFRLVSSAFKNEGRIPRKHGTQGAAGMHDVSPPLEWYNVPDGTETLALIVEDVTESADSPTGFVHWVVANIPPTLKGLPAGFNHHEVEGQKEFEDIQEGVNDAKAPGYRGPSPASEQRLEFRLYALDTKVNLGKKVTKDKLEDAMEGHVLAETMLVGGYCQPMKASHDKTYLSPRDPMDGQQLYYNVQNFTR